MKEIILSILMAQQAACLQEALYHEARGEGFVGMVHVAATIHNRVLDSRWPDTYCGVIEQPWQYSYRNSGTVVKMADKRAEELAGGIAEVFMELPSERMFDNILYYHTTSITTRWNHDKLEEIVVIGNHVFYSDTLR